MAFFDRPISDAAADIQSGRTASRDVVARALGLIEKRGGGINAFITVCGEAAQKKAEAVDKLSPDQKKAMPLCGIPVAVKDNICTSGIKTTCASRMLENFVPPYSAAVVEALEAAGAIIVGKTNLDEFAAGPATGNSFFGPTHNPHNHNNIPGCSTDGSAAAVSAGFVPAAFGTDTGGSVRQPSSHCGVAGMRPTYGRVSRYGAAAFASSLDQTGPMANSVRDIGLLLSVISTPDRRDPTCAGKRFVDSPDFYRGDVSGLRAGIPVEYFCGSLLSSEVRAAVEASIEALKNKGAKIVDVSLQNLKYAAAAYCVISAAEASSNLARYDGVKFGFRAKGAKSLTEMYEKTRSQAFGPEVKRRIILGTYALSSGHYDACYLKAAKVRTLIANDFTSAFNSCDVIVSPVTPVPAFGMGQTENDPLRPYLMDIYTVSASLAGIPALVVPCPSPPPPCGSPIGVQFMAPRWREDLLLRAGYAIGGGV